MIRLIYIILLSVVLCAFLTGCKGESKTDQPQGEHPQSEESQSEHPQSADSTSEHPQSEDSTSEHPQGEHPQ